MLAGRLDEGLSREQALARLVGNLRRSAEAFAPLGIRMLCEAINPLDMPGFLLNTPEQLEQLLRAVDRPNCAAQLDLYHMAPAALRGLRAAGYDGWLGAEYRSDARGTGAGLGWLAEWRRLLAVP